MTHIWLRHYINANLLTVTQSIPPGVTHQSTQCRWCLVQVLGKLADAMERAHWEAVP